MEPGGFSDAPGSARPREYALQDACCRACIHDQVANSPARRAGLSTSEERLPASNAAGMGAAIVHPELEKEGRHRKSRTSTIRRMLPSLILFGGQKVLLT